MYGNVAYESMSRQVSIVDLIGKIQLESEFGTFWNLIKLALGKIWNFVFRIDDMHIWQQLCNLLHFLK